MARAELLLADCREVLPALPAGSFDAVLTDPPYPEIDRPYGRLTEAEWWDLMRAVVPHCMRLLRPSGSAVFVLQPNFERAGRMRAWLWEFLAWVAEGWGVVQDLYWWNYTSPPGAAVTYGLARSSVKHLVWSGPSDCYRDQSAVLLTESDSTRAARLSGRLTDRLRLTPSGRYFRAKRTVDASGRRGGVTPFNLLPIPAQNSSDSSGALGHPAGTPLSLCDWLVRYLVPPGGRVLDPFAGVATFGVAALRRDCDYLGVERVAEYVGAGRRRLASHSAACTLFDGPAPGGPPPAASVGLFP